MNYRTIPKPTVTRYSIHDAVLTHKGDEYKFWVEHDLIEGKVHSGFDEDEPQGDFDWNQFAVDVENMILEHEAFMKELAS